NTGYSINRSGFNTDFRFRVYCSEETHSSIEKAVKIAGIGRENIVKLPVDKLMRLRPDLLRRQIEKDIATGYQPLCIIATLGTTGTTAIDPLEEIAAVATAHDIWMHVDAAYAGSALLLPEYQKHIKGIESADSFVFNPHKWLFTNFDCSAYFVKDKNALIETFEILPEYLRTQTEGLVANHCDWGIPMGRRFRSLKLWFVMRYYGLEELQNKLRKHIELARWLEEEIQKSARFEVAPPRNFNLVCFRFVPEAPMDLDEINAMNEKLLQLLNSSGQIYLTHTKVNGIYTLRMVIGQTRVEKHHVEAAWKLIQQKAREI
ncbi:MAG: pyridoxal-dependent decarboxylase, partial [Saprospiraceae bacterium]|nr:pyridoxal-dependent decarboxylase [Saprospiraceae bacterium]